MRSWKLPLLFALLAAGTLALVAAGVQRLLGSRGGRAVVERLAIALEPDELGDRKLETADEMAEYLAEHPDRFALAAWEVGQEDAGLYHDADRPWPLTWTVKIIPLALASEKFAAGEWDAGEPTPLRTTRDGGVGTLGGALHSVRHGEYAAIDLLFLRLGRTAVVEGTARLGPGLLPPHPPGSTLQLALDEFDGGAAEREDQAWDIAARLADGRRPASKRQLLPVSAQEAMARELDNRGSARAFAKLLERLFSEEGPTWAVARAELALPLREQTRYRLLAGAAGSLPGTFTLANFGETLSGRRCVVALFLHDVPFSTMTRMHETSAPVMLTNALLLDDAWIEKLRARLARPDGGP